MNKVYLVLLSSCFCFLACQFDDYIVEKPYLPMPEEINAYFNIPTEGSIYIFEDSTRGVLDTSLIKRRDNLLSPGPDYVGESFYIWYESGHSRDFQFDIQSSDKRARLHIYAPPSGSSYLTWDKEQKSYISQSNCHQQLDSVILTNGQVYYDVFELTCAPYYQKMWFAKGIGLIMKEPVTVISGEHYYYELIDFQKK